MIKRYPQDIISENKYAGDKGTKMYGTPTQYQDFVRHYDVQISKIGLLSYT